MVIFSYELKLPATIPFPLICMVKAVGSSRSLLLEPGKDVAQEHEPSAAKSLARKTSSKLGEELVRDPHPKFIVEDMKKPDTKTPCERSAKIFKPIVKPLV